MVSSSSSLLLRGHHHFAHTHIIAMPSVQKLELEKHEMRINDLFEVEMVGDNPKLSRKH